MTIMAATGACTEERSVGVRGGERHGVEVVLAGQDVDVRRVRGFGVRWSMVGDAIVGLERCAHQHNVRLDRRCVEVEA